MKIEKVSKNTPLFEAFLHLPYKIYKDDSEWIPPLISDIRAVFDVNHNKYLNEHNHQLWLLSDEGGNPIGRIAAFEKAESDDADDYKTGGVGFFECINQQEAANLLFQTAEKWLESKGFEAMDGPINIGERNRFWGLLVKKNISSSYGENYHPPYYRSLFENYGFRLYFEQNTFLINVSDVDKTRIGKLALFAQKRYGFRVEKVDIAQIDRFAEDFIRIYNPAWSHFNNFKPLTKEGVLQTFAEMKSVMDEDFVHFAYQGDQPAGVNVMIPEINQILKFCKGKTDWWNKLKLYYYFSTRKIDRVKGLVFGIHPDFQQKGVDALLVNASLESIRRKTHVSSGELSWIGGFNKRMMDLMFGMNGKVAKVHHTYRKPFHEGISVRPYQIKDGAAN